MPSVTDVENVSTASPLHAVAALATATQNECLRDRATLLAAGLLGVGTLSLHATTVFTLGGEAGMRAELAANSMMLAGVAAVAFALLRHGGVEWSRTAIAPLVCSPLGRGGWFIGRMLGVTAAAALLAGAIGVATVALEGFAAQLGIAAVSALASLALLATGGIVRGSRPTSALARACGGGGVACGLIALLMHAIVGHEGVELLASVAGAGSVAAVLAAAGLTASMWLPVGGAVGVVAALYLLGHVAVQAVLGDGAGLVAWRVVIPDLAGIAAVEWSAVGVGLLWGIGVAWLGCERALIRES